MATHRYDNTDDEVHYCMTCYVPITEKVGKDWLCPVCAEYKKASKRQKSAAQAEQDARWSALYGEVK